MFGKRWRLFRLFGIPIGVDPSWLVILALLTWTMAGVFQNPPAPLDQLYPEAGLGLSGPGYLLMGLVAALAFFLCILLHEMGHALVARAIGMPIHGITLFLFGGVAELDGEPPSAGSEFAMAVAGPVVSFVLTIVFALVAWAGHAAGWFPEAVVVLAYLAIINASVLVFNLVPAFPLDGGRVLRSILWAIMGQLRRATYWAALCGEGFAWLLILWGVINLFGGTVFGGIWLGLIGMFLLSAARSSYQQVVVRQTLAGEPVRRFMKTQPIVVSPDTSLRALVEDYVYRHHHKAFPVVDDGQLVGFVSTRTLSGYPRDEWDRHTVAEVMERNLRDLAISPDTDALKALEQMQRTGNSRLLVVEGNHLAGIISLKDLLRFLQMKLELEGEEKDQDEQPPRPLSQEREETLVHR
jgi:Zn-dependent protease/CBS domain-containing protein